MQLYNTKVVPSSHDAAWLLPPDADCLKAARLLIFSAPYARGSADETTLSKMMGACRLESGDFFVVQLAAVEVVSWQATAAAGAPARVLLLGIAPAQVRIAALFLPNVVNQFLGAQFVWSYNLTQIERQPEAKKALWKDGLKPMLGIE